MKSSATVGRLPPQPVGFEDRITPLLSFLFMVALVPLAMYRLVQPLIIQTLGVDMTGIWPRTGLTILGATVLLLIGLVVLYWEAVPLGSIGLSKRDALLGSGCFLSVVIVMNLFLWGAAVLFADGYKFALAGLTPITWIGLAIANWGFVGLAEELTARAYLQNKLIAILGANGNLVHRAAGILLMAVLFAVWHVPHRLFVAGMALSDLPGNLAMIFVIAVIFGIIYEVTRNVALVALVHGAWNFPPVFFSIHGSHSWQGGIFLVVIVSPFVVGIISYWLWIVNGEGSGLHPN